MLPVDVLRTLGFTVPHPHLFGYCRDRDIPVMRDPDNGVIFLLRMPPDSAYERGHGATSSMTGQDTKRRRGYVDNCDYYGQSLLDYGCGDGAFVTEIQNVLLIVDGYDPSMGGTFTALNGSVLTDRLATLRTDYEVITLWHALEHFRDPIYELARIRSLAAPRAQLLVEVPHARSWLLHNCTAQLRASLWSDHLILHTAESLRRLLLHTGWRVVTLDGVQRYSLRNALSWLTTGKGDGGSGAWTDSDCAWAAERVNAGDSDTLLCVAEKVE